jgi:serine/threonine-protein kinase
MLGSGLTWLAQDAAHRRQATEQVVGAALADADRLQGQLRWIEAWEAARRAEDGLATGAAGADICRRVASTRTGLELVVRLEEVRLESADGVQAEMVASKPTSHFDGARTRRECARVFRDAGIDLDTLTPEQVADRIPPAVRVAVAAAVDDWVSRADDAGARRMRAVAQALDPDPWRGRLREVAGKNDPSALLALTAEAGVDDLPPSSLARLGLALQRMDAMDQAIAVLRRAQRRHPADFWINYALGSCLMRSGSPVAAVRFLTAAVALRPRSAGLHNNIGLALRECGSDESAMAAFREAIRLQPSHVPHFELGKLLRRKGDLDQAITQLREAVRLAPGSAVSRQVLADLLARKGLREEAVAEFRKAIALRGDNPDADLVYGHVRLGRVLEEAGLPGEAATIYHDAFTKAAVVKPNAREAFSELGKALCEVSRYKEALAAYREAIRVKPDYARAHSDLAFLLANCPDPALRDAKKAVAHAERAVELAPNDGEVRTVLGVARYRAGDWDGAVEALNKSVELQHSQNTYDCFFLAMAHWQRGGKSEAQLWYAKVARWMDGNQDGKVARWKNHNQDAERQDIDEHRRLRAEAAELLGVSPPPPRE